MSKHITKFDLGMLANPVGPQNLTVRIGFDEKAVMPALEALRPEIHEFAEAHPNLSRLEVYQHFQPQVIEILSANTVLTTNNS